jgi:hypothetical protein
MNESGKEILRFSLVFTVFGIFEGQESVCWENEIVESIELVEFYLEPVFV